MQSTFATAILISLAAILASTGGADAAAAAAITSGKCAVTNYCGKPVTVKPCPACPPQPCASGTSITITLNLLTLVGGIVFTVVGLAIAAVTLALTLVVSLLALVGNITLLIGLCLVNGVLQLSVGGCPKCSN